MAEIDLYLRKSKVVRTSDPRDLLTIETQEARGRDWAASQGHTVRHVWVDNLSAWSDVVRPAFDGALAALHSGEVPILWCAFLDRFTRKGIDEIGPILGRARVVFDYDGLDSSRERDRRWIIDTAERAREFSTRLSYGVRSTKLTQRQRGEWLGAAPFGLEIVSRSDRRLRHSADWGRVLHVFRAMAHGMSRRNYCLMLNELGVPSPTGGVWHISTVAMIINNPVYEGWSTTLDDHKRRVPWRNAAGEKVWVLAPDVKPVPPTLVAQARAVSSKAFEAAGKRANRLATGRALCGGCGGPMSCAGAHYTCSRHATGKACPEPALVQREALERYLRDRWVAWVSTREPSDPVLATIAERYTALRRPADAAELREAQATLKGAENAVRRLVEQQAAGMFEPPFDTHLPRLQAEARSALGTAKDRLAKLSPEIIDISFLLAADSALDAWETADAERRRDLLHAAVSKVWVKKGVRGHHFDGAKRVKIEWAGAKPADGPR